MLATGDFGYHFFFALKSQIFGRLLGKIVRIVRDLQHRFNVIDFTNRDIDAALVETGTDIEDNVQYVLAMK